MPIRPLPPLLVNQIAAGEVIERPASVVKELVENAIDAAATRVDVAIEQGGRDLVRVADDGEGIAFEELPLAVAPHATSKIADGSDLDGIATMGFRGEALASIASVSRTTIVSRPRDADEAGQVLVEGGTMQTPRPAGGPPGTTITVRNLFFNTPARRKFLRRDQTEATRVVEIVQKLAIAHPAIGFSLTVDGRARMSLPAGQSARQRVLAVVGEELADELLELDASVEGIAVWGLLGRPGIARPTARHLRLYLNGRPIADRTVVHAVREAYRGLIAPDRHPTAVIMLAMDPHQVDVNVHPAKAEVRFRDQSLVHRVVHRAVQRVLAEHDLVPELRLPSTGGHVSGPPPAEPKPFGRGAVGPAPVAGGAGGGRRVAPTGDRGFVYRELAQPLGTGPSASGPVEPMVHDAATAIEPELPPARPVVGALQVHRKYIVTEDDEGLVIIDQHALHERVMFETLKRRITTGALESQRMLMPVTVDVDETQVDDLVELEPLLKRLGIEAEPIGPRSVAIHAFTSLLFERRVDPAAFMRELLARAGELRRSSEPEAALHEVLDMMSCKAAVKSGDRLTPEELAALLARREDVERSSRCPHGRPTTLRLSLADLDRQFGR
jgi:DNA mismatch repair protein MutL